MLKRFKRQFFSGLVIFVPLSLTIYFFRFVFLIISQTLLPILVHQHWVDRIYVRPASFVLTILLIWGLGVAASNYAGRRVLQTFENIIRHIPFFRGMYEAIQKMTEAFFGTNPIYQSVVLVEYPRKGVYTFGFVTSTVQGAVFHSSEPYWCVFIPTVPNPTSGVLLYVPQSETIPLTLSIEEAAKILVSHGFVPIEPQSLKR